MRPVDVQFLRIADDSPVYRHRFAHDAEFHESAGLPNHAESLLHRLRMPCRLNVDIAAVAFCQIQHLLHRIRFCRVNSQIRAQLFRDFQPLRYQIDGDEQAGVFQLRRAYHPEAQCAGPRDDDDIAKLNLPALHGVNRTSERLNHRRVCCRHI